MYEQYIELHPVNAHACVTDYEEIDDASVIITNANETYSLNLTIYSDGNFSEPNETLVIYLFVDFMDEINDKDAESLRSRIFFDLPTTTVTIISSGKVLMAIITCIIAYHVPV